MRTIFTAVRDFLTDRFNLNEDKEDEELIIETIRRDVAFRGTNLWALIFAIFIASIGLNVNSTAVIIGAMLISPLMGPIMGVGLSIGISDFELLKKSIRNLFIAALFSVITSFLYFTLSPLDEASSELLARTNPSVWDVFIAFFGGLAGVVAGTRKRQGNVIPGVAIATALMPPLCTAGYGLATGQLYYFLGAGYLFFINCLFICLATFLIVKHLGFRQVRLPSPEAEKRVSRFFFIIVALTILPSIYFAYRIVQKSIFESNAARFVKEEFRLQDTQVISHKYNFSGTPSIEVLLFGRHLPQSRIDSITAKMKDYHLAEASLHVHQGSHPQQKFDLSRIDEKVLQTFVSNILENDSLPERLSYRLKAPGIHRELKALYPGLDQFSIQHHYFQDTSGKPSDTVLVFMGTFSQTLSPSEHEQLKRWLGNYSGQDSVQVIIAPRSGRGQ